jgi:hypothetical protein
VLQFYVRQTIERLYLRHVEAVALDETAARRGQKYVTVSIDLEAAWPATDPNPAGATIAEWNSVVPYPQKAGTTGVRVPDELKAVAAPEVPEIGPSLPDRLTIDPGSNQPQNPPHPRSPIGDVPGRSYRSRRYPPNLWTVPRSSVARERIGCAGIDRDLGNPRLRDVRPNLHRRPIQRCRLLRCHRTRTSDYSHDVDIMEFNRHECLEDIPTWV